MFGGVGSEAFGGWVARRREGGSGWSPSFWGGLLRNLQGYDIAWCIVPRCVRMSVRSLDSIVIYCIVIVLHARIKLSSALFRRPRRKAGCWDTFDVLQTPLRASYEAVLPHFAAFSRLSAHNRVIRSLCSITRF